MYVTTGDYREMILNPWNEFPTPYSQDNERRGHIAELGGSFPSLIAAVSARIIVAEIQVGHSAIRLLHLLVLCYTTSRPLTQDHYYKWTKNQALSPISLNLVKMLLCI